MTASTLAIAQTNLDTWIAALSAVNANQAFEIKIGGIHRKITRADLDAIRRNIDFWGQKCRQLSSGNISISEV